MRVICPFVLASIAVGSPLASQAPQRTPTCAAGLKIYARIGEVPTPHDTVRITFGVQQGGLQPLPSGDDRQAVIRRRAGAAAATGIVEWRGGEERGGMQSAGGFIPVFVASDAARINKACTTPAPRGT